MEYELVTKHVDLKVVDDFNNIINANFDLQKNSLNTFEFIFFNDSQNKLILDADNSTFNFTFNKDFNSFLVSNFNQSIFELANQNYIVDFNKGYIEGKLTNEYLNNITSFSSINKIISSFKLSLEGAEIDYQKFILFNKWFAIQGPLNIIYEGDNYNRNKKLKINLDESEIKIEKINFVKPSKDPLTLNLEYVDKLNNQILLKNLQIDGNNIFVNGEILLSNNFIQDINLKSFKLLNNDFMLNFTAEFDDSKSKNHLFIIDIQGNKLDLSFLNIKETKSLLSDVTISLNVDVKDLYYINNTNFIDAKLYGRFKNVWKNLRFRGRYGTEGDLNIILKTNKDKQLRTFEINSSNAEKTLKVKKITKSITGGRLRFTGNYTSLNSDKYFDSKLFIKDFAIKKKSKLAGFIKVIRIFDIKKQLAGDTEDFEYLEMKINKNDNFFNLIEGKAYGGLMALTIDGKINKNDDSLDIKGLVAPTHAVDSWIGKIPIVGDIITGIDGGGVIAANYTVKGTIKKPKYFVNPLSILTPGIFKDFWKIFNLVD